MAKKTSDITKTGGLNYKQLQRENADIFAAHPEYNSLIQDVRGLRNPGARPTTIEVNTGQNIGSSKYDVGSGPGGYYTAADIENLEQLRYENQSTWDTIGNGLTKFMGKVGSTIIGTFAGIPAGIGTAISEGRWSGLWDNSVTQSLAEFDDYMEKNFKNYQSNNQQNASWNSWENFTSAKFWMDDVVTNAGFTVGAMISGNITGGLMGLGAGLARGAVAGVGKKLAQKGFTKAAESLIKGAQKATGSVWSQNAAAGLSSLVSATGEGSVEAKQAQQEYTQNAMASLQVEYGDRFKALEAKYKGLIGKSLSVTPEGVGYDPALEEYKKERAALQNQYKAASAQVEQEAREVGNRVLLGNQVLLTFGNMVQFGKSFSKSYANATKMETRANKALGSARVQSTGRDLGEATESMTKKMAANKGKATEDMVASTGIKIESRTPWGGRTRAALKGIVTEGSEEMNQQWITSGAESLYENRHKDIDSYWKDRLNNNKEKKEVNQYIDEFGQALADGFGKSWGDFDQWEQFLIGGMMGAGGMYMPTKIFNQDKSKKWFDPRRYGSYEGGMINDILDYNKEKNAAEKNAKALNELLATEKFWNTYYKQKSDMATALAIQKRQDKALEEGDKKGYKDEEDNYYAHIINTFARAGKIEDLRAIFNHNRDLSDEEIESIVANSQITNDGTQAKADALNKAKQEGQALLDTYNQMIEQQEVEIASTGVSSITNENLADIERRMQEKSEEIDKINNTPAESVTLSPFTDTNGTRTKTNDEIRKEFNDTSDALNKKIDMYLQAADRVQEDTNGRFTNEQEDTLTWLAYKHDASIERGNNIFRKSKIVPKDIRIKYIGEGDNKVEGLEAIKKALSLENNDITDNGDGTVTIHTANMVEARQQQMLSYAISNDANTAMLNEDVDKIAAKEGMTQSTRDAAVKELQDYFQLKDDANEYQLKLLEYTFDSSRLEQDKEAETKKAATENHNEAIRDLLGNSDVHDFLKRMYEGEDFSKITPADIAALDDETRAAFNTAIAIFKKFKSISDAIDNSDMSEAEANILHTMLKTKLEGSDSIEDFMDITKEDVDAVPVDDLLELTGFSSIESLAESMDMADKIDASNPDDLNAIAADIKSGALEKMEKVLAEEEKKSKKSKEEIKPQTEEEQKKKAQEEEEERKKKATGRDGGTPNTGLNERVIPLTRKIVIKGGEHDARIIKVSVPASEDFELRFEYLDGETWKPAYLQVSKDYLKEPKNQKTQGGDDITLESLSDKEGNVRIVSIHTGEFEGHKTHYVQVSNGKQNSDGTWQSRHQYVEKDDKKFHNPLKVWFSKSDLDAMLGLPAGTLGAVTAHGQQLKVGSNRTAAEVLADSRKDASSLGDSVYSSTILKPRTSQFWDGYNASKNASEETKEDVAKRKAIREVIWKFLNEHHVWDNQRRVQVEDDITFGFSTELNEAVKAVGGEPVLLMFDKDGNVVGDIATPMDIRIFNNNGNVANLYNYAIKQGTSTTKILDKNGNPITTKVAHKYIGTPQFTEENKPASETLVKVDSQGRKTPDFELGVAMGQFSQDSGNGFVTSVPKEDKSKVTIPPSARNKPGLPYVLIHTSDPERPWMPVSILMDSFSLDNPEIANSEFVKIFTNELGKLKRYAKENNLIGYKDRIRKFLNIAEKDLGVYQNDDGSIVIKYKNVPIITLAPEEFGDSASAKQLGEKVIKAFSDISKTTPIPFDINKDLFNETFTRFDSEGNEITISYKDMMAPLIKTNAAQSQTVNDFFDVNPILIDDDGNISIGTAEKLQKRQAPIGSGEAASKQPTKENPKYDHGGYWYKEGDTIVISDKEGNPIKLDENTSSLDKLSMAETYLYAINEHTEGTHDIPFLGKRVTLDNNGQLSFAEEAASKNPTTNAFVEKLKRDQKEVNRRATTAESYTIAGELKERLHHAMDRVYMHNVKLDSDTKKSEELWKQREKTLDDFKKMLEEGFEKGYEISDFTNEARTTMPLIFTGKSEDAANDLAIRLSVAGSTDRWKTKKDFIDEMLSRARDVFTGFRGTRAIIVGQAVDEMVREFFLNPDLESTLATNKWKHVLSTAAFKMIKDSLRDLYNANKDKYTFLSDRLVVDANLGGVDMAGEIDLIVIDKETGKPEIWDIKTSVNSFLNEDGTESDSFTTHSNRFLRSSKEQYTIQLNAYKDMIKAKYGIDVVALKVLPIWVTYNEHNEETVGKAVVQDTIKLDLRDNVMGQKPSITEEPVKQGEDKPIITPKPQPTIKAVPYNRENLKKALNEVIPDGPRYAKKITEVLDTVDQEFTDEEKSNLAAYLTIKKLDFSYKTQQAPAILRSLKQKAATIKKANVHPFISHNHSEGNVDYGAAMATRQKMFTAQDLLNRLRTSKYSKFATVLLNSKSFMMGARALSSINIYDVTIPGENSVLGFYNDNSIYVDMNKIQERGEDVEKIILHEFIHSYTVNAYNTNTSFKNNVDTMFKQAVVWELQNNGIDSIYEHYGFSDVYEFLAEALSNEKFAQELGKIPYKKKSSLLDRFIQLIRELFHINTEEYTILDEVVRTSMIYATPNAEYGGDIGITLQEVLNLRPRLSDMKMFSPNRNPSLKGKAYVECYDKRIATNMSARTMRIYSKDKHTAGCINITADRNIANGNYTGEYIVSFRITPYDNDHRYGLEATEVEELLAVAKEILPEGAKFSLIGMSSEYQRSLLNRLGEGLEVVDYRYGFAPGFAEIKYPIFKKGRPITNFDTSNIDLSQVDVAEVPKPWKSDPTRVNNTLRIMLKGQPNKGYFELVKDEEDNYYSVHFKTTNEKGEGTTGAESTTKEERNILYEQLINAIPNGAFVSTWGSLSRGGVIALNRVGKDMEIVDWRDATSKEDASDILIPVFQKKGFINPINTINKASESIKGMGVKPKEVRKMPQDSQETLLQCALF